MQVLLAPNSADRTELAGVVDVEEEVVVRGGEHVPADAHLVAALGPPQDADDDLVELLAGPKEERL